MLGEDALPNEKETYRKANGGRLPRRPSLEDAAGANFSRFCYLAIITRTASQKEMLASTIEESSYTNI